MQLYENDSEERKERYYAQLRTVGVNVNALKDFSSAATQLQQLYEGLATIMQKWTIWENVRMQSPPSFANNSA